MTESTPEAALAELRRHYDRYVDGYRDGEGRLPAMMQLKYEHIAMVVRNAELIAAGEGFEAATATAAVAAAQLHDVGRYEQLRQYDTFRDADSVDHAVFSHRQILAGGWLELVGMTPPLAAAVLKAVLWHNRRELPADESDPLILAAAHTVRDADKLDIFRTLEHQVAHSDWRHDCRAFWNLPISAPASAEVVTAIVERRTVDYQDIKSLADFVLIQVGWMVSGLHFATSRRLCRERGHLKFRRDFLRQLGAGEVAAPLLAMADTALASEPVERSES